MTEQEQTRMRTRVLVMMLGALLAACAGEPGQSVPQTEEASPTPESTPFAAHLAEYLDPAWTSPALAGLERCGRLEDGDLEGYINGKLIIVSADTGQLLVPPDSLAYEDPWPGIWDKPSHDPLVTPTMNPDTDWGLPWASTPDEVGTVVVVWENERERSIYNIDGSQEIYWEWGVRLVDFQAKAVVGDGYVSGSSQPWQDLFAALRARLFAAPFTAYVGEYLAPEWASQLPVDPRGLDPESYINGKLIMVSADAGEILRPIYSQTPIPHPGLQPPDEPGPPDWGLPWADTPEEVGTVVVVWAIQERESAYYIDGGVPYRESFMVKLVDFQTRTVIGDGYFYGDEAGPLKTCSGDVIGPSPWADLMEDLRALPQR